MPRDYYEVLELPRTADAAAIKKAHRKLARKLHPDVNKDDPSAATKFQEVQEAYDVLGDPEKRKMYDQFGHAGVGAGAPGGGGDPFGGYGPTGSGGPSGFPGGFGGRQMNPEDLEELRNGQFGDIFEGLFGSAGPFGRRGVRQRPGPGDYATDSRSRPRANELNIEVPVTIDFRDAANGTTVRISTPGEAEKIEAKVPPGVKDGQRVRLRGRGQRAAGVVGDLILVVSVRDHAYFRRDGLNVLLDVPVTVWDALLGGKVEVPTLDGKVTLTIPPGSSSGQKLRIKGQGITKGPESGDQLCVVKVIVPKSLTDEQKQLVEQLKDSADFDPARDAPWR
ncbi:MAG: DnaJ C-terminal domain-containing protein [Planctomycetota bacterium]